MNKKIVDKGGRPTKLTEDTVNKLEAVYKLGVSDATACRYAGISKVSLYKWHKANPEFLNRMNKAKEFARIAAGQVVVNAIVNDKDVNTAKWWLEKKYPEEFSSGGNTNIAVSGEKVLVIPSELMEKYGITSNTGGSGESNA